MRTIISHFKNEEYLLPWWLKHHLKMFDYGVMINHSSTDGSIDIIREMAPHWRIVNSRLNNFDAFLTDLEVMNYEMEVPGWKIVLNTTEFLLPSISLPSIEQQLISKNLSGFSCTGFIVVDPSENNLYDKSKNLIKQIHWGFNDNNPISAEKRLAMNLGMNVPSRNRFYHRLETGMYQMGRHLSYHPHSKIRTESVSVLHYAFAPWTEDFINRKLAIKNSLNPRDVKYGWGNQHLKSLEELNSARALALQISTDLSQNNSIAKGISLL